MSIFDTYLVSDNVLRPEVIRPVILDSQTCLELARKCDVSILSNDICKWGRTARHGDSMKLYYGVQLMKIDLLQLKRQANAVAQLEIALAGLRKIADFRGACGYLPSKYEDGFDDAIKHCHGFANEALKQICDTLLKERV